MLDSNTDTSPGVLTQPQLLAALLELCGDLDVAEVLQQGLPDWLLGASSTQLAALSQLASELQVAQARVENGLRRLKAPKAFCREELSRELAARWPAVYDVEHDHFEVPEGEGGSAVTVTPALLSAAMCNFTEEQARATGFPADSVIRVKSAPSGVAGLTPTAFAGFCRELDLGRRYQDHLRNVFGLTDTTGNAEVGGPMAQDIAQMKKHLLALDMHLARIKGDIEEEGFLTLQRLIAADGRPGAQTLHYKGRELRMQGIEIRDSCIWGVVVFSVRSIEDHPDEWCLVYMPGEPHRPLFEYPDFNAFKQYLTLKLSGSHYRRYLANVLDEDNRADFLTAFSRYRELGAVKAMPFTEPLFGFLRRSHVGKLQIDARTLVVPTADLDEQVRQERQLGQLEAGVTIAMLAGFFVPMVGQLMLGVTVGQFLAEVYEGVEDWRHNDRHEAFTHLLNVAENIVLMASIGTGQKVAASLIRRTIREHPAFFDQFTAIVNSSGLRRLWKPELTAYEQRDLGETAGPLDFTGLFRANDKTLIRIDGRDYAVALDRVSKDWRLQHPERLQAYAPKLESNGEGGWRLAAESSEQWPGAAYILKRIDPRLASFGDSRLEMICRLTGTTAQALKHLSDEGQMLPSRLRDLIDRFGLEGRVQAFIEAMDGDAVDGARYAREQLHMLPTLSGWPTHRYIDVLDEEQYVTASYPPTMVTDHSLCIDVTVSQVRHGQVLGSVLGALNPEEVQALLGAKLIGDPAIKALGKKLAAAVRSDRRPLFDRLYQEYDQSLGADVSSVRRLFPEIPARHAQALINQATSVERSLLRTTGRIPMTLAQKIREVTSAIRLDRALSGLYLPQIANADSEKLSIGLLSRLPGWSTDLRLEVRDKTLTGPLLDSTGPQTASSFNTCTLVKSARGFAVYAGDGALLGQVAPGADSLFDALLIAMPPRVRIASGFPDPLPADSARLRNQLLEIALDDRGSIEQFLLTGTLELSNPGFACLQGDMPAVPARHPKALERKVRKLYPSLSDVQVNQFLDELGSDHMTRAIRLRRLSEDWDRLWDALELWSEDQAAMRAEPGSLSEVRLSRQSVSLRIIGSWRRMTLLPADNGQRECGLKLDGIRVGKLPTLPIDVSFDHVRQLSLKNMALDNDVAYFLKAFKALESLELDSNRISLLPEMISHMPRLKRLSLSGNQLKLTEQTLIKLSRLRTLQSLNLSDNPLGATLDVGKMFDLRYLSVRNTRATELPKGLVRLPNLDRVDLRDNDIRQLPDWLFDTPRRFSQTINLRHNPLSDVASTRLADYRNNFGIGMGYLDDDFARLDELTARTTWFAEGTQPSWSRRQQIWTALRDEPRAEGLFRLLAELGNTADSQYVREDMNLRVWAVLEATESNAALREQVLELAANPINCTDSAALNFSHLELATEVDRVIRPPGGLPLTAEPLLDLGRRLFRLDQLERIAAEQVVGNPQLDPLEVSLAYRTGLAQSLQLPGQPRHMRFANLSGVTAPMLQAAEVRIRNAELSHDLHRFMIGQTFWTDYLRRHHSQRFGELDETFAQRMEAVFDKAGTLSSADYLQQLDTIKAEKERAETTAYERLTEEVSKVSEFAACAIP